MAPGNKVLWSINIPGEDRCVDIFTRSDDSFGFEEYRRDFEDNRGWFPIGFYSQRIFDNQNEALDAACQNVPWLDDAIAFRGVKTPI